MKRVIASLAMTALCAVMFVTPYVHGQNSSNGPRAGRASDAASQSSEDSDQYFVRFVDGVNDKNIRAAKATGAAIRREFPELKSIAVKIRNANQLDALRNNPDVELLEIDPKRYPMGLAEQQLTPTLDNGLYGLLTTKATTVHGRGITGVGINVGVADTSLDYNHPDILLNYKGGIDTVSNDNDPINDDGETHGTHVAGTILGVYNSVGVYGVAYNANLYHARVLGPTGGYSSDIMDGVRHLVEVRGCKIVNMSLGGGLPSTTEQNFYNDMRAKGALIVAATGNDGATSISYPAGYASNVAVGAVDRTNTIASFSNKGTNIDVVAPGVSVLSSVPRGQGFESSVTTNATYTAFGMEYAGTTNGITKTLVDCGLGQAGECPSSASGNVALIQRGTISFADKILNAMNAGAVAAIIYNNAAGDFTGTLGATTTSDGRAWIPAVTVSDKTGATLKSQVGSLATVVNKTSDWDHYDGTSMATPHVSGVLALIWSVNSNLSNSTVEGYLFNTATDLGVPGYDTTYGRGIVNADAAVTQAQGGGGGGTTEISLSARGYKSKGSNRVDLSWSGASGSSVDIYRNGTKLTTTANDGAHTDSLGRSTGSFTYKVCNAGTSTCSNEASVTF